MHTKYLIQMDVSTEECFQVFQFEHIQSHSKCSEWHLKMGFKRSLGLPIKQDIQAATAWSQQASQKKAYITVLYRSSWPFPATGVKRWLNNSR